MVEKRLEGAPCGGLLMWIWELLWGIGTPWLRERAAAAAGMAASERPPWCACPSSLPCAECGRTCRSTSVTMSHSWPMHHVSGAVCEALQPCSTF